MELQWLKNPLQPRKMRDAEPCPFCDELHLSFAGGAVLSFFDAGAAYFILENFPKESIKACYGVSGGTMAAAWMICAKDADDFMRIAERYAADWHKRTRVEGPKALATSLQFARLMLERYLPFNAHKLCDGVLHIPLSRAPELSLTGVQKAQSIMVSRYASKGELIDVIIASMAIPFLNTILPRRVGDSYCFDYAFVENQFICCENVVCISPFKKLYTHLKTRSVEPKIQICGPWTLSDGFNVQSDLYHQFDMAYETAREQFERTTQRDSTPGRRISLGTRSAWSGGY